MKNKGNNKEKPQRIMKRILIVAAMLCCTIPAFAQTPKVEIFGGYSFARQGSQNLNKGWVGSVTGNFNKWFGIEGDVSGQYWSEDVAVDNGGIIATATGTLDILTYRAGPKFSFRSENSPVTPFAHVLIGGAHMSAGGSTNVGGSTLSVSQGANGIAGLAGGGIDIGKGPIVVRTQVDYSVFNISDLFGLSGTSNGLRVSGGIVFRIR